MFHELELYKDELINKLDDLIESNENLMESFDNENISNTGSDSEYENDISFTGEGKETDIEQNGNDEFTTEDIFFKTGNISEETTIEELLQNQNDLIESMNKQSIENSWLLSLTMIIALGFHYFINQFSKW